MTGTVVVFTTGVVLIDASMGLESMGAAEMVSTSTIQPGSTDETGTGLTTELASVIVILVTRSMSTVLTNETGTGVMGKGSLNVAGLGSQDTLSVVGSVVTMYIHACINVLSPIEWHWFLRCESLVSFVLNFLCLLQLSHLWVYFFLFSLLSSPLCALFLPIHFGCLYNTLLPHPIQPLFLSSLLLVSNLLLHSLCSWGMDSIRIWPSTAPCTVILC